MEKTTHRGKLWKIFESERFLHGMWKYFTFNKGIGKKGISGSRSRKTRISDQRSLGASRKNADTDCNAQTMRRAYNAKKLGEWESFKENCRKEGKLCQWTFQRLQEANERVAVEDTGRLSVAQEIRGKSTDFSRRIIAPMSGMGGVTLSHVCLHCSCFLGMTTYGGCRPDTATATTERRSTVAGGVQHAEAITNGERPTGYWWCKSKPTQTERKSSKRTQRRWVCPTTWSMR